MNSQTNLTTAKIRRTLLIAALVICPFLAINSSNAQTTVTATLLSGGSNSITITTGISQFQLDACRHHELRSQPAIPSFTLSSTNGSGFLRHSERCRSRIATSHDPLRVTSLAPVFNDPTTSRSALPSMAWRIRQVTFGLSSTVNQFRPRLHGRPDQTTSPLARLACRSSPSTPWRVLPAGTYTDHA